MVGFSDESRHLPTNRQALNRMPLLFPTLVFTILLASLIAAGSVSAQESAACDQYECTEESATCDQYGCAADPAPEEPAPVEGIDPTAAGTLAVEPAPKEVSAAPIEEDVSVSGPTASETGKVIQENVPTSAGNSQYRTIDPPPTPQADLMLVEIEATNTEPPEIERDSSAAQSETSAEEGARPEDSTGASEDENGNEEDENRDDPLPGYPYEGELCEERTCGLEEIEAPVECAVYETTSGKEVYGCSNPMTYEKKGCYEITFYTQDGKPYSYLDTCSGEKPYAPPQPPEGDFDYWAPPEDRRGKLDPYDHWNGYDLEEDLCRNDNGDVQWHCGLEVPRIWSCGVLYGTIHGTVRGCFDPKDFAHGGCYSVHLYDEVGNLLGIYEKCFASQETLCGKDQCGLQDEVPARWECSRIEYIYSSELYDTDTRVAIWCEDPILIRRLHSGRWNDNKETCAIIFNEEGRRILRMPCTPQGDSQIGRKAGKDARNADETLNGHDKSTWLADGSISPDIGELGSNYFSGAHGPEERTSPASNATDSTSSPSGAGLPLPMNILDPSVATLEQDTLGSPPEGSKSADTGSPSDDISRSANMIPDGTRRKTSDMESDSINDSSYSSPGDQGQANNDSNAPEPREIGSSGVNGSKRASITKNTRWPEIAESIRGAVASFPPAGIVEGLLGTVVPLAGLGAVSGVLILRKRFLR